MNLQNCDTAMCYLKVEIRSIHVFIRTRVCYLREYVPLIYFHWATLVTRLVPLVVTSICLDTRVHYTEIALNYH